MNMTSRDYFIHGPRHTFWVFLSLAGFYVLFSGIALFNDPRGQLPLPVIIILLSWLPLICVYISVYSAIWKLSVQNDLVVFHILFRKAQIYKISDISEINWVFDKSSRYGEVLTLVKSERETPNRVLSDNLIF